MDYSKFESGGEEDFDEWIYAYADMMTLLLGFFVMIYSFSKFDDKKFESLAQEMTDTFKGKSETKKIELQKDISDQERKQAALEMIVKMLKIAENTEQAVPKIEKMYRNEQALQSTGKSIGKQIEAEKDPVMKEILQNMQKDSKNIEIILPNETLFPSGGTKLSPQAKKKIHEIAKRVSGISGILKIEVIGHSDSSPVSKNNPFGDNFGIASARAGSVSKELMAMGIDPKLLLVRGMGPLDPLFPEFTASGKRIPENQKKNRRVHIVVRKQIGVDDDDG
ncbi:MAG: OmpA family protein [Zetaproteobacteria bacterium]|nr:OmpA family protein [Zetaproteobacteria bacterium]